MNADEAERRVPENTKAVIALLKKGMFGKSLTLTAIRIVIYGAILIFSIGKASEHISIKMSIAEMNMFDKLTLAQKDELEKMDRIIAKLENMEDRLTDLEYYTGKKKVKQ